MGASVLFDTVVMAATSATTSGEQRDGDERMALVAGCFEREDEVEGNKGVCEMRRGRTLFALPPSIDGEGVIFKTEPPIAS